MKNGIVSEEGIFAPESQKQRVMWRVEIWSDFKMMWTAAEFSE